MPEIPRILHQIWLGSLQPPLHWMKTWQDLPGWEYRLWTEQNLPSDLVLGRLMKQCPELCGQADLLRYELLFRYGGVYVDADSICLRPLDDLLNCSAFAAYEQEERFPGRIANGVMGAVPNHALMQRLVENAKPGSPAWMVTGPLYLTKQAQGVDDLTILPHHFFWPIHWSEAKAVLLSKVNTELTLDKWPEELKEVTRGSYAIQLWGSTLSRYTRNTGSSPTPRIESNCKVPGADSLSNLQFQTPKLMDNSQEECQTPLISICISLKNRSRVEYKGHFLELFPNCVRSLSSAAKEIGTLELVITDFFSDDWPLSEWLNEEAEGLATMVLNNEGNFSRGEGLNCAARGARSDNLFLCDADMLVPPALLSRAIHLLSQGTAFFPICRYLDAEGQPGNFEAAGFGNVFVTREMFELAGGIPPFNSWGGEDDIFYERIRGRYPVVRDQVEGFEHQWHPQTCRHDNYALAQGTDYQLYRQTQAAAVSGMPTMRLWANHPYWQGEVHLFAGGRMSRPGIDTGSYEIDEKKLVLIWDCWPAETLFREGEKFICADKHFILTEYRKIVEI